MLSAETSPHIRISVEEADAIVRAHVRPMGPEVCDLSAAAGRVLREEVRADRELPPFDRVTMDGIAISFDAYEAGCRRFPIEATQPAGAPPLSLVESRSCIEVMTGASLPKLTDCVIPVEELRVAEGVAEIADEFETIRFANTHRRGTDYPSGTILLYSNQRLAPAHVAVCASVGRSNITVAALPRIVVVATGDELVPVNSQPLAHQIRISNSFEIAAVLSRHDYPASAQYHVRDDMQVMMKTFEKLLDASDVVVLSGGVSAGKFDMVPAVLGKLGVARRFHRVTQRPGLPLWFGSGPRGQAVFALPGNPVSTLVSTRRYVIPYLDACAGVEEKPQHAALAEEVEFAPNLTYFLPVSVRSDPETGRLLASPRPVHSSGDFARLIESDGFVELPAGQDRFPAGSAWRYYAWSRQ
ncbi:MAG TPA: molybdopterin molybdotransferase MoeA [Spirochaetia bacterium]|nr:molybdopterin molybdotransferase MoeA [Spirochaetia bacterium]